MPYENTQDKLHLENLSDLDYDDDTSDSDNDSKYSNNDSSSSLEDLQKLPEFLSSLDGLDQRFNLACKLIDNPQLNNLENDFDFNNITSLNLKIPKNKEVKSNDLGLKNLKNLYIDNLTNYFVSKFTDERVKRKTTIDNMIKLEEERIRKIEEERRKKEEEERRRREEEERKKREEEERKIREEAERKRLEEERILKQIEEEKKRKEAEKKAELERLEKLKKEKELKLAKKEKEAATRKELELKQAQENIKNMIIRPTEIEKSYLKYMKDIEDIENQILKPVQDNKELKKLVGSHRRKINPKFGQLTNSQQQLSRITNEIKDLILQTQSNELAFKWILNFISDAIISQAETEVSVKPKSSLPLAKLTLNLLILFKDLSYFLFAKFYKSCSFLLGYSCSQDTEEGRVRLGWNRDENTGKWENESQYNERLSGISTLYFVITKLKLDSSYIGYDPSSTKHPLPISNSWIFLSRIVDVPVDELSETHYTIAGSWWDACAIEFLQAYGKQATKLLRLVSNEWTNITGKSSAAKVRLNLLGEEWVCGSINSFPEMEQ
jgi:nucleoporin GLE1